MDGPSIVEILGDPNFIDFVSTFGLGVVLVLYFVFIRDPRHTKYWQGRYDDLAKSYKELSEDYKALEARLDPEKREMSDSQALKIGHLALDRDLFKLWYRICEKLERGSPTAVKAYLEETIMDTNETWAKFKSPFPRVPVLTDLYGVYLNGGAVLASDIDAILDGDSPDDEKRNEIWNRLLDNCISMKRELSNNLKKLDMGVEVKPYKEPSAAAKAH